MVALKPTYLFYAMLEYHVMKDLPSAKANESDKGGQSRIIDMVPRIGQTSNRGQKAELVLHVSIRVG